ncbi:alpha-ketoglutarate-dependent dioxygenase AlkB [Pikeienuella piscinae]|uniref:Alpha-ketoglutarate-dependent dioxygenase AlkB n=1 Tax=Pikeienuella piscinae TaxID=2748098 RepID=A0A7M3T581_9RHOB|nr:alpha-ketoglutarate-dependent dioxygenase AlkB [Pikeienuella piscinae]QIE57162.1 alpha-ketoglutarate-dependent dioxygenase AlkB [Pikeienuella piscinae]
MLPDGVTLHDGFLDAVAQIALVGALRTVAAVAPPRRMEAPNGRRMSVAMTSAGRVGWVTDRKGYRYEPRQMNGAPWPPIPAEALAIWRAVSGWDSDPDCLLLNHYAEGAKMGLHRDADEGEFAAPVVSVSLGDPARFRIGGLARRDSTKSFELRSGDVLVMGGASRLIWHGVDRIRYGVSPLLARGGRLNLTMRVVAG